MTDQPLRFPAPACLADPYYDEDVNGPLPCGCYRVEVYDFGHKPTCPDRPPAETRRVSPVEAWDALNDKQRDAIRKHMPDLAATLDPGSTPCQS